jgi:hypothetical protein
MLLYNFQTGHYCFFFIKTGENENNSSKIVAWPERVNRRDFSRR